MIHTDVVVRKQINKIQLIYYQQFSSEYPVNVTIYFPSPGALLGTTLHWGGPALLNENGFLLFCMMHTLVKLILHLREINKKVLNMKVKNS